MSMEQLENMRLARGRGAILKILVEDYGRGMTSVGDVVGALDALGLTVSPDSLRIHLMYLEDQGYVKIWRTRDMPGFRRDRLTGASSPDDMRFARLLPAGLQLLDGDRAEDPKVKFEF